MRDLPPPSQSRLQPAVSSLGPSDRSPKVLPDRRVRPPTLDELRARKQEILRVAAVYGASNIRVFGSVARGQEGRGSDVDLLVDITTDKKGFAFFGLIEDLRRALEELLGCSVDVSEAVQAPARERVERDAVPL
jgi:uncharacterized protein